MPSEYKMRTTVYFKPWVMELSLEEYTRRRFEVSVTAQQVQGMRRKLFSNIGHLPAVRTIDFFTMILLYDYYCLRG